MRADGLRDDDPPYRGGLARNGGIIEERAPLVRHPKLAQSVEQMLAVPNDETAQDTVATMLDAETVVALIREHANGQPFVRVDRLIAALS